jgi:hypothetical protein
VTSPAVLTTEHDAPPPEISDPVERRRQRAAARAAERAIPPQRHAAFRAVTLTELRMHRQALIAEEDTVSYWRRLIQARLDVVRAGEGPTVLDAGQLRAVLSGATRNGGRTALVSVIPSDDLPPLPDLARLWASCPMDEAQRAVHEQELSRAEAELSAYRSTLHRRLDAATGELIARYHEDPTACLVALPLPLPREEP